MKNKFRALKVHTDDGVFDSHREYKRWRELKKMEAAGDITDLQRQVVFPLVPSQKRENVLKNGRKTEIGISYKADFVYRNSGEIVVEDAKGFTTPDYVIKRKLMLYVHHIEVLEV